MSRASRRDSSSRRLVPASTSSSEDVFYTPRSLQASRGSPLVHSAKPFNQRFPEGVVRRTRQPVPASMGTVLRDSVTSHVRASGRVGRVFPTSPVLNTDMPGRSFACARRSIRREVLFATRSTGAGARSRVRLRARSSSYRC